PVVAIELMSPPSRYSNSKNTVAVTCGPLYDGGMTTDLGLRERKNQRTRELIAETARRLFTERGFDAVTVTEIARAAEVAQKTVFNHFPTKEDLVCWRLETFEDELLEAIRQREPGESVLAAF